MAKKAVATLREKGSGRNTIKCIRMVRSERSGAYVFQEELTATEEVKNFFAGKKA
ncbi:MAG: DUF4295 domain-containing protein [Prevotellaceae bacterium]|jgi:hypothetical protein|nr:DUF4295 domain-containing protein [Prevotellaceae bacterium]